MRHISYYRDSEHRDKTCSRSRRPGSIAALGCAPSMASPPPLFPVTSTGLHCGRSVTRRAQPSPSSVPGHVDRAPLRPRLRRRLVNVSDPVPGHVDRAPLRPCPARSGPSGSTGPVPGHVDRAPLRHSMRGWPGSSGTCCSRSRRPGSIAAAPLLRVRVPLALFPVTSTGLHCGEEEW